VNYERKKRGFNETPRIFLTGVLLNGGLHALVDTFVMRTGHQIPETGPDVSHEDKCY